MKIAMALFKYFPFGDLQSDFLRIAEECVRRGHEVTVFTGNWLCPETYGLDIRIIRLKSGSNHGKGKEFEKRFGEMLREEKFDVVVGFNRMARLDFYFAADNCLLISDRAKHSKLMLALNPRYRTWHRMEREVMDPDGKSIIMYITPRQKEDYMTVYGTPEARFRYLPPGIDPGCRRPANAAEIRAAKRSELGLNDDELMLILVGSDFRRKGGDRLVQAASQIQPEELRRRCKIYLVGNCSPAGCDKLAYKLGIGNQVILTGGRLDVPELLLAADLMVHPARNEAAGNVLVEALAAGLPVICSETCGFSNFVKDSGGIVTPEPFDQNELNVKLTEALQPERLNELKTKALEYGEKTDFYRRATVAADLFEEKCKRRRR